MRKIAAFIIAALLFLQIAIPVSAQQDIPCATIQSQESSYDSLIVTLKEQYRNAFQISHSETAIIEYDVEYQNEYDYITVSYASTENVELSSYQTITLPYQEGGNTFGVSFHTIADSITDKLGYGNTAEGQIYLMVEVYLDHAVVQKTIREIGIYITPYGDFISGASIEFAELFYYDWLLEEAMIDQETYDRLERSMHLPDFEFESPVQAADKHLMSLPASDTVKLAAVNMESVKKVDVMSKLQMSSRLYKTGAQTSKLSQLQLLSEFSIIPTTVTLTYTITALNSGKQLRISGYVNWTDIGEKAQIAKNNLIKIHDEDTIGSELLATTTTNANGYFDVTVNNQTGILDNGCDIYIELFAQTNDIPIQTSNKNCYIVTPTVKDVMNTQPTKTLAWRDTSFTESFYIGQAFNIGCPYVSAMNNGEVYKPSKVDYIADNVSEGGGYSPPDNKIAIFRGSYSNWDTIIHEYGHCVAEMMNIDSSSGGTHSSYWNMAEVLKSKSAGVYMAWSEGWATYFSISSQLYMNASSLGIFGVGDTCYNSAANEIEGDTWNGSPNIAYGEANERAVSRILLDLADNTPNEVRDTVYLGYQTIWNIAKSSKAKTLSDYIAAIYNYMGKTMNNYSAIGKLLIDQNVAAGQNRIEDANGTKISFLYTKPEECAYLSYQYEILITKDDQIRTYLTIPVTAEGTTLTSGGLYSFTLTEEQYNYVRSKYRTDFYWCVVTKDVQGSPATGPYYSEFAWYSYE